MKTWFGNISVTLKLALGFGLVLLLTMALALVGWSSLGSVVQRSERMADVNGMTHTCLLYTSPSPRDLSTSRMPSSA